MAKSSEEVLKTLSNIIIPRHLYSIQGGHFRLIEESPGATCKEVQFKKTGKILILKFDQIFGEARYDILPFYREQRNVKRICDYIVIYPQKDTNRLFVFVCELKSSNVGNAGEQARAGFHLAEYLVHTALRLLRYQRCDIEYRALIFSTRIHPRGGTNAASLAYEQYPVIDLKFKHLPCNFPCDIDAYCF